MDGIAVGRSVSRHKFLTEIASIARIQDGLGWDDKSHRTFWVSPVSSGIIKGLTGFGERSIPLLSAHIKILRTDTDYNGTFVLQPSVLDAPYRDDRTDLNIGSKPVLDRLFGLVSARRLG